MHNLQGDWSILLHEAFASEVLDFDPRVRCELFAHVALLQKYGPHLKRPYADTLKGSRYANMKELRFTAGGGVWRVAFAFDPERHAVLLVGADKSGQSEKKFYRALIARADKRFDGYLKGLRA